MFYITIGFYIVLLCIMYAFLYLCVVCVLLLQRINK